MTSIEGFVPLASYDEEGRSRQSGHSPNWKILREAIDAGDIDGFQHGGSKRWLVNKEQADRHLRARAAMRELDADDDGDGESMLSCLRNIEATLEAILEVIDAQSRRVDAPHWHPQVDSEATA